MYFQFQDKIFNSRSNFKIQNKMPDTIHLSDIREHTITKILHHDLKSELGITITEWVKHNKL